MKDEKLGMARIPGGASDSEIPLEDYIKFAKQESVLPRLSSPSGVPGEKPVDAIAVTSVSGGADEINRMPRSLTLSRLKDGEDGGRAMRVDQTYHQSHGGGLCLVWEDMGRVTDVAKDPMTVNYVGSELTGISVSTSAAPGEVCLADCTLTVQVIEVNALVVFEEASEAFLRNLFPLDQFRRILAPFGRVHIERHGGGFWVKSSDGVSLPIEFLSLNMSVDSVPTVEVTLGDIDKAILWDTEIESHYQDTAAFLGVYKVTN